MNKNIFKSIQQSMIESTFMDFYFPERLQHPLVIAIKEFQSQSSQYRFDILNAKTEVQLEFIAHDLEQKVKNFDQLSKEIFPGLNYFFSSLYKNDFNFSYMKELRESNYEKMSFFQKMKLKVPVFIPENYEPTSSMKKTIFEDFGFQYLHVPNRGLTAFQTERAFYNFIEQTKSLMTHMDKPESAISLHGQIGLFLEKKTPLYGHLPKALGFTPDITSSSILHEWSHSIDNHIFHKLTGINEYASENLENFPIKNANFLPAYHAIKKVLFKVCNFEGQFPNNHHEVVGKKPSIYFHNCMAADEDLFVTPHEYYQKPCEILARIVESGEFPEHTRILNKNLTNLVYLSKDLNPYSDLKEAFFSVVAKPTHKIAQIREQKGLIPEMGINIPKNGIGKHKF